MISRETNGSFGFVFVMDLWFVWGKSFYKEKNLNFALELHEETIWPEN